MFMVKFRSAWENAENAKIIDFWLFTDRAWGMLQHPLIVAKTGPKCLARLVSLVSGRSRNIPLLCGIMKYPTPEPIYRQSRALKT